MTVVHGGPGAPGEVAAVAHELSSTAGVLEPIQTTVTIDGQVQELRAIIEANASPPLTLIGFSWGAWLSCILSSYHPKLVKKLILVSSGPITEKYASSIMETSILDTGKDTVYLAVTDKDGNSVSFINSLYEAFGSGIVVGDTGICLQNRGSLFAFEAGHPNCIEPHKRPYHTIIPAMVFRDGHLFLTFGVMGGFMQPQGHIQVLHNIIDFGMDVQTALDALRFRYIRGNECAFEPTIPPHVLQELADKGHNVIE